MAFNNVEQIHGHGASGIESGEAVGIASVGRRARGWSDVVGGASGADAPSRRWGIKIGRIALYGCIERRRCGHRRLRKSLVFVVTQHADAVGQRWNEDGEQARRQAPPAGYLCGLRSLSWVEVARPATS